ncbi:hypothetical protein GCK72_009403 [Caenorhabditis remanei]|nr:hypothetical protein GCK72_009403 [Caenorhabditis remanei]KAF1761149.1 hypothetical protein GCK72_009403 [Caenorhabditis remanei]
MSHRADDTRKHRKSRSVKKDHQYPFVSFDGEQSFDIPADEGKSPVRTRMSLASNPDAVKYLDEIALLKARRIDKDAPRHPYDRRGQPAPPVAESFLSTSASLPPISPNAMTFMGGPPESEKTYKLGKDGTLKVSQLPDGGERFEVASGKQYCVFQQSAGQTCLCSYSD